MVFNLSVHGQMGMWLIIFIQSTNKGLLIYMYLNKIKIGRNYFPQNKL